MVAAMATARTDTARPPDVGDPVSLADASGGALQTVVVQRDEDRLCLGRPRLGGQEIALPVGIRAAVDYTIAGVPCRVPVVTAPPRRGDDPVGLWVTLDGPPERNQRRESFRVPAAQPIELRWPNPDDADGEEMSLRGTTADLSVSGTKLRTDGRPEPADRLRVAIELDDPPDARIEADAEVVDVERPHGPAGIADITLAFSRLDPGHEDLLRGFLLTRERERRRREVGLA